MTQKIFHYFSTLPKQVRESLWDFIVRPGFLVPLYILLRTYYYYITPTMTPKTFHYFPTLPTQVREAIWDFAVRPRRPGVHLFAVYDSVDDTKKASLLSPYRVRVPKRWSCHLAAPQVSPLYGDNQEQEFSWVRGNRSTYLIDFGLWAACAESRAAMERRFKVDEQKMMPEENDEGSVRKRVPRAPDTSCFFLDGQWYRCLTYTKKDLFFLQPYDLKRFEWDQMWGFPFYNPQADHIALDYALISGEWDTLGDQCVIVAAAGGLEGMKSLWFVDYSLRRRVGIPPTQDRDQFHGNGCIFTEVKDGDMDWYRSRSRNSSEDEGEDETWNKGVSFGFFLSNLEHCVIDRYNEMEPETSPEYELNDSRLWRPRIGFLAYEECAP